MKKYKLNQAYIDRELALYHKQDATEVLKIAEQRLNEQAKDCKEHIIAWALQGMSVEEIKEQLVDWNNHTLANHPEVIHDIYKDAINRANLRNKTITYHRPPTLTCVEDLCNMVGCDIKHETDAEQKIEGILNYLQEQGVINEYNADRLDYVFGNDQPY